MPPLRIAITLPGEASLGTFEAGAMAALVVGLQAINEGEGESPVIDVLTGASSGALTAVLAARVLLAGEDPVRSLRRAWVSEPTLDALKSHDTRAPLTLEHARDVAGALLSQPFPEADAARRRAQSQRISLDFALACLRGWTYQIPPSGRQDLTATSYVDWSRTWVGAEDREGFTRKWADAVDAAIASASHPLAFPPTALDRSSPEIRAEYERNRVTNFPDGREPGSRELWYSDGGLVDRQPLGRCVSQVWEIDGRKHSERVILVLRPEAERAPTSEEPAWTEAEDPPTWRETLSRALRIVAGHSLHEDLRAVEKINQRIQAKDQLEAFMVKLVGDDRDRIQELAKLAGDVEELRKPWRHDPEPPEMVAARAPLTGAASDDERVEALVQQVLETTTGLANKIPIKVEMISGDPAYLTGGGQHQFGGFLAESLRSNDFLVGYEAMLTWMHGGLHRHGVSCELQKDACDAATARAATIPGWLGGITTRRRASLRTQQEVVRVGLKAAWIALKGRHARSRA